MLKSLEGLKGLIKVKVDAVDIDNPIFRLHYKVTAVILLLCSVIVTTEQFVKEPIHCVFDSNGFLKENIKALTTFCWISGTYTIPSKMNGRVGQDVSHPGVAFSADDEPVRYHNYYQWVCFALFFQAILFYMPRYWWKASEAGLMKMLAQNIQSPVVEKSCKDDRKKLLVDYFMSHMYHHSVYMFQFCACEVLNFINVVVQLHFLNLFLGGPFDSFGSQVFKLIEQDPSDRCDPMSEVFPVMTKCDFHTFGPSGTVQKFDGNCVLPINILNQKIYVVLWAWFLLLSIVTALMMVYRLCTLLSTNVRKYLLLFRVNRGTDRDVRVVMKYCGIGDWFIVYQLSKNIDQNIFTGLICDLANKLLEKPILKSSDSVFLPAEDEEKVL